jgi:tryptophanyl-tRNA synthetase
LHIGHYVGSLRRRVELQNSGAFDEIYIMIADTQALTDNFGVPQKVRDNIIEVALDYLAAGIDPSKSTIFVQSQVPELFELTSYYLDLVTFPVWSAIRRSKARLDAAIRRIDSRRFLCYPVSQAADITAFDATVVPVGEDQEPMIEQANEIVKIQFALWRDLVPCKIMEPDQAACKRLPGTDGKAKMSKSLGNCIYLSDDAKTVKESHEHVHRSDPP